MSPSFALFPALFAIAPPSHSAPHCPCHQPPAFLMLRNPLRPFAFAPFGHGFSHSHIIEHQPHCLMSMMLSYDSMLSQGANLFPAASFCSCLPLHRTRFHFFSATAEPSPVTSLHPKQPPRNLPFFSKVHFAATAHLPPILSAFLLLPPTHPISHLHRLCLHHSLHCAAYGSVFAHYPLFSNESPVDHHWPAPPESKVTHGPI